MAYMGRKRYEIPIAPKTMISLESEHIKPNIIHIKTEPLSNSYPEEYVCILTENRIRQEISNLNKISFMRKNKETCPNPKNTFINTYSVCPTYGCGARFKNSCELIKHISDFHASYTPLNTDNQNKPKGPQIKLKCLENGCRGTFHDVTVLEQHIIACHNSKTQSNFKCNICNIPFDFKWELEEHQTTKSCTKVEKCSYCNKRFMTLSGFLMHYKKYIGSNRNCFKCGVQICNYKEYCKHKNFYCKGQIEEKVIRNE